MAYVYYIPPAPVAQPAQERTPICSPQRTGVYGPVLIFTGGASALVVGFFERNPAIIWPVISLGIILCATGVFLARRHVRFFREMEQDRQRAMWRSHATQHGIFGGVDSEGAHETARTPAFDVPMFCLEAPSRPLPRVAAADASISEQTASAGGRRDRTSYELSHSNSDLWCALAVPLHPDDVSGGQYLEWKALTLVVQPHFKFHTSVAHAAAADGAGSPGMLTKTGATLGSSRRTGAGPLDAAAENDERPLDSVSLTLTRTPSIGLRPVPPSNVQSGGGGGGSDRRNGRSSLGGYVGDLLSLFASVAGGGGGAAPAAVAAVAFDAGVARLEYDTGAGGNKPRAAPPNPPKSPAIQESTTGAQADASVSLEAGPSQPGSRAEPASPAGLGGDRSAPTDADAAATVAAAAYSPASSPAATVTMAAASPDHGRRRRRWGDDLWGSRSRDQAGGDAEGGGDRRHERGGEGEVAMTTIQSEAGDAV